MAERRRKATVDDYLGWRDSRGELSRPSIDMTRWVLYRWHHDTGWVPPSEWTQDLVVGWVLAEHLRPNSQRARRGRLVPYLRWVGRGDLCDVPRIRVGSPAARDLTGDAVARLLQVAPDARARAVIMLMVHCGLRCGDLARVRIEDLDVPRRRLHVRGKGGRGEPTHWVPVPGEAWAAVTTLIGEEGQRSGALIRSRGSRSAGGHMQAASLGKLVAGWMRYAGVKVVAGDGVSAHALRHTCAQGLVDDGADLRLVQHALGHESLRTTELYVRREPVGLREAMEGRRYVA